MESFTDDTVVALASFLSPCDMLSLALTCKRFGDKHCMDTKQSAAGQESGSMRNVRQKTENNTSLMEAAARTVLLTKWTNEEKNALPRRGDESWIGIYQEFLKLFHYPLHFDKLVGDNMDYSYSNNVDKSRVCSLMSSSNAAICSNIMRAGKHYVSFNVSDDDPASNGGIACGIMRPTTKDITSLSSCSPHIENLSRFSLKDYKTLHHNNNIDCCLLNTSSGCGLIHRMWTPSDGPRPPMPYNWEGQEETDEASFKIGMVLDLDEGTLDVYKNDRRLGTMRSGLVGEYCWVALLVPGGKAELSVSIGR